MMTLAEAKEVKDSSYWGFIKKELSYRIECKTKTLRSCDDIRILDKINATIDTLEEIMQLPEDVIEREE